MSAKKYPLGIALGGGGADDGVVAPQFKFAVDFGKMCVVAEDDRETGLPGCIEQTCGRRDDGYTPFTSQGAVDEILKHVDYEDGGMVEDQRFLVCVFHF